MKKSISIILFVLTFTACVKDKPQDVIQPMVQLTNGKKVYVVNEGNFGSPNASISLYDPGNEAVIENFYQTQNPASPTIGDVAQSLSFINGNFYVVVNNSGKIIVCDGQFKKINQIIGLSSPRYIQAVTNQKAYVSDFNGNVINVINLNTNTKTASIACPGWTEKMALIYNKVYICNMKRNYTYVINTVNDLKTDSVLVGPNAGSLVIDKQDKLWVLSGGDSSNSVLGKLVKIDPVSNQVEASFQFNAIDHPLELCINKTKDTLYFLNGSIYRMAISSLALPSSEFINRGTKNFYGLGINPNDHTIYAADALDYNSKANIYIYNASGNEKKHFNAGINANGFYFE